MKRMSVGLAFVAVAVLLVFKDSIQLPNLNLQLPLWLLICSAVFVIGALANLLEKDYMGSIGSLAILFIIFNAYYDILPIGTGTLVVALVLASLGFQLMDKKDKLSSEM